MKERKILRKTCGVLILILAVLVFFYFGIWQSFVCSILKLIYLAWCNVEINFFIETLNILGEFVLSFMVAVFFYRIGVALISD